MNGDFKIIYDAVKENNSAIVDLNEKITSVKVDIMEAKTRQEERHTENVRKFETIFFKLDKVRGVDLLRDDLRRLQWLVFVVLILGILLKLGG